MGGIREERGVESGEWRVEERIENALWREMYEEEEEEEEEEKSERKKLMMFEKRQRLQANGGTTGDCSASLRPRIGGGGWRCSKSFWQNSPWSPYGV